MTNEDVQRIAEAVLREGLHQIGDALSQIFFVLLGGFILFNWWTMFSRPKHEDPQDRWNRQ